MQRPLPLTAITAWELLFDHLQIKQRSPESKQQSAEVILVVGAAGGVGSILIQIAKAITGATIIGTASREPSKTWVQQAGADYVVNHSQPLGPQIENLIENNGVGQVTHIASLNSTHTYFDSYEQILVPFGRIAMIDDPEPLDLTRLKFKSLSLHWEFMFARSLHKTPDMIVQSQLLNRVADLVDQGYIKTTAVKSLGSINADNLEAAHQELESGQAIGKIVLQGFE